MEPAWQLVHAAPPVPQRAGVVALMQAPEEVQHPEGQFAAEQLVPPPPPAPPPEPVTHWPVLHDWEPPQVTQS